MARWKLYVGVPVSVPNIWEFCEKLEKAVNAEDNRDGSGIGLGFRDIDWSFTDKKTADARLEKATEFLSENEIPTQTDPKKEDWRDGKHAYAWVMKY